MDQSIGGGGTDAALERLGRSLIRSLNSMPKPSDDLSDEQLHQGLTSGDFEGRDALVAEEILRRRHDENSRWRISLWTDRSNGCSSLALDQGEN